MLNSPEKYPATFTKLRASHCPKKCLPRSLQMSATSRAVALAEGGLPTSPAAMYVEGRDSLQISAIAIAIADILRPVAAGAKHINKLKQNSTRRKRVLTVFTPIPPFLYALLMPQVAPKHRRWLPLSPMFAKRVFRTTTAAAVCVRGNRLPAHPIGRSDDFPAEVKTVFSLPARSLTGIDGICLPVGVSLSLERFIYAELSLR